jgi:hypothetical protein
LQFGQIDLHQCRDFACTRHNSNDEGMHKSHCRST